MNYAKDTNVNCERSRAEIETTLNRYGATEFAYATRADAAMIGFVVAARHVRFVLPLPARGDDAFIYRKVRVNQFSAPRKVLNDEKTSYKHWEQACRQRWRALALCIKAKLESVECGIATFEGEFLAHIVLANGQTIGEKIIPQLDAVCRGGSDTLLLLN